MSDNWYMKRTLGGDCESIRSDSGRSLEPDALMTYEQAEEIVTALNAYLSDEDDEPAAPDTYTITDRVGNLVRVYAAPYADEAVWMAAQGSNQNADVEPGAFEATIRILEEQVKRVEELEGELKEWKECAQDNDQRATDLHREVGRQAGLVEIEKRQRIAAEDRLAAATHRIEDLIQQRSDWQKAANVYQGIIDSAVLALQDEFPTLGRLETEDRRKELPVLVEELVASRKVYADYAETAPGKALLDEYYWKGFHAGKKDSPTLPNMPLMRAAFKTLEAGAGRFNMIFKLLSLTELHDADDEWLALLNVLEAQK